MSRFLGGRGDPPARAEDPLSVRVALMHTDGVAPDLLLIEAAGDPDALRALAAMEKVRPGGARPDVLAAVLEQLAQHG